MGYFTITVLWKYNEKHSQMKLSREFIHSLPWGKGSFIRLFRLDKFHIITPPHLSPDNRCQQYFSSSHKPIQTPGTRCLVLAKLSVTLDDCFLACLWITGLSANTKYQTSSCSISDYQLCTSAIKVQKYCEIVRERMDRFVTY